MRESLMDDDRLVKWFHMVKADIRLKDIPIEEIDRVPESIEDVSMVGVLLASVRGEKEDDISDSEMMRRTSNVILNLGQEALRRRFGKNHAKMRQHGEVRLREADTRLHFMDAGAFVSSVAMKIREKSGIELCPEEAAKIIREVLSGE